MKGRVLAVLVGAIALIASAMPVFAHHSFAAEFDAAKPVTLTGVVTKVEWMNPHTYFYVDVKDPQTGKVDRWGFEAGTPSGMIRNGFKQSIIKAGTEVTIKGFMARDASQKMGLLRELTTADGKVYGLFGSQQGPAAQ